MTTTPFAFVLMPFSEQFEDIYKLGIKAAASEAGIIAERVDEQRFSEPMLERIYRQIDKADFIVADMTGRNANVFYEVGYAHAKGKLCTLLTQSVEDIPFDLMHHRHVVYDGSISKLKEQLSREFDWLRSEALRAKTNPFEITLVKSSGFLTKGSYSAAAEVDLTFEIRNSTERKTPEIEAIYIQSGKGWTFSQDGLECSSAKVDSGPGESRHFLRSPVMRIAPGMWAQIRVKGKKTMWSSWTGDEIQDSYRLSGFVIFEIVSSKGKFSESVNVDLDVDDIPF